jgi:hypothetical protein
MKHLSLMHTNHSNSPWLVRLCVLATSLLCLAAGSGEPPAYPPPQFPNSSHWGRNIQRTLEISGGTAAPIAAIRIYQPPLGRRTPR